MEKFEEIVRAVYKEWKDRQEQDPGRHPDEEAFINFIGGSMPEQDSDGFKAHVVKCSRCADILASSLKLRSVEERILPQQFQERMKDFILRNINTDVLDILLGFKDKILRLLHTNGDVLIGQELVPASVLRSRQVKDFKDELNILKDCKGLMVDVKIIHKGTGVFEMVVRGKEKQTQKPVKDLRFSLLKNNLELESFHTDSGKAGFEHITSGRYKVEISRVSEKLAEIDLEIQAKLA